MDRFLTPVCDLHTHTNFSDGTLSPRELVEMARGLGIRAIALTDHNTIEGLPRFLSEAKDDIELIPGIEFSTTWRGKELHIIALGITEDSYLAVRSLVNEMKAHKKRATDELIASLIAAGYKIDKDRISEDIKGQINRAHIATELVRCGYVGTRAEAFEHLLSKDGGFYREAERISSLDTIRDIGRMGGVSILAHPLLNITPEELVEFLTEAKPLGLDAMEVIYSEYSEEDTALSYKLIEEFSLLPSGGSDFHGSNKPDITLGRGKGELCVPYSICEALLARLDEKRQEAEM